MRQLLTLFAVLTGLAATAAPAQAHFAGAETRMEAAFEIVVTADRRQQEAALVPVPPVTQGVRTIVLAPGFEVPASPGALVGIDRARE